MRHLWQVNNRFLLANCTCQLLVYFGVPQKCSLTIIVTRLQTGQNPAGASNLLLPQITQTGTGTHPASEYQGSFLKVSGWSAMLATNAHIMVRLKTRVIPAIGE
jgi:hypothetical protein